MKTCSKCKRSKPLDDFHRNRTTKDGRTSRCKECAIAIATTWNRDNHAKHLAASRKHYSANSERILQERKDKADPEALRVYQRDWNKANLEKRRAMNERWRKANPDKNRAKTARRRALQLSATTEDFTQEELLASYVARGYTGCVYCSGPYEQDDHFYPLSRGGEHSIRNLVPACAACNQSKNAADPYEWMSRKGHSFTP